MLQLGQVGDGEKVKVADDGTTACRLSYPPVSSMSRDGAHEVIVVGREEGEIGANVSIKEKACYDRRSGYLGGRIPANNGGLPVWMRV